MNRYKDIPIKILQTVLILLCTQTLFAQKVVHYELYKDTGKLCRESKESDCVTNHAMPLTFTEGDLQKL